MMKRQWREMWRTTRTTLLVVRLPKEERLGSRFGSCICGKPAKDGIRCQHMVVFCQVICWEWIDQDWNYAYWLTTAHWQAQKPWNLYCRTEITMKSVQAMSNPEDDLRFCPRNVAQRRTSASRVSRITSKNQQRRSGRGEWDISAISAISSTTTLRIARRIQPINRGVVGMVLLPSMMLLLMNMPNWKPNWKPSIQANHEPQAHACHESHGPTQVSWIPDESHKGSHKGSHKKNPTKTIGRRDPTSKGSHKHTGCNRHRSAIGRNLRSSHNFIFISEPNVLIWLC